MRLFDTKWAAGSLSLTNLGHLNYVKQKKFSVEVRKTNCYKQNYLNKNHT